MIGSCFRDGDSTIRLLTGLNLILQIEAFQQEAIFLPHSYGDDASLPLDADRLVAGQMLWQDHESSFTGYQYVLYGESDYHMSC